MTNTNGTRRPVRPRAGENIGGFHPGSRPHETPRRISDWVYGELAASIRNLALAPGTPLSEPSLASQLGVSRAPVRDALTRLADQRLVVVVPQVGTRVAPILMSDVAEACFIRSALEVGAFETAIAQPSLDTTNIRAALVAAETAVDSRDTEGFFLADEELHQQVFALAGFPTAWDVIRGVKLNLDRLRWLHLPDALANPHIHDEHRRLVNALEHRDSLGVDIIRTHAQRVLADSVALRQRNPEYFEE